MARRLENLHGKSLDVDPERNVERDGIGDWMDDIDKENKSAERFEREEKIRKEAQSVTEQIKALDGMSREELESERDRLLSLKSFGIHVSPEISFEIDKRIRQAERLEKEALNKSTQSRTAEYTGPMAAFMAANKDEQKETVEVSRYESSHDLDELTPAAFWRSGEEDKKAPEVDSYTSNQLSDSYSALAFASPEKRQELEAELLGTFKTTKAKEAESGRIDKATHDLQELARGHEFEIDKGDKDF